MARRVVVTGGAGFVAQWLARALLRRGDEVTLAGLEAAAPVGLLTGAERAATRWLQADIRDAQAMDRLFAESRPDLIVHLAGISYVPEAEGAPEAAFEVNVVGTVRLLSSALRARSRAPDPLVIVIGSGTQYGIHRDVDMPLDETAELRPISTYAATKTAQEVAALQIARATGLRIICTRSFSHSGVGHDPVFLIPSLVRRIRALESHGTLRIGNDVVRDYLHVEDAVAAYIALAELGKTGEVYNVCSGVGVSVSDIAGAALQRAGVQAEIVPDVTPQRASDMPVLVGSPKRLEKATGWFPTKTHLDILDDLFNAGSILDQSSSSSFSG